MLTTSSANLDSNAVFSADGAFPALAADTPLYAKGTSPALAADALLSAGGASHVLPADSLLTLGETFSTLPTDTLLLPGSRHAEHCGVAGTPVPYTLRHDNAITISLLASFLIFVVTVALSKGFLSRQLKALFYLPYGRSDVYETSGELRFLLFLVGVDCFVLAIGSYLAIAHMPNMAFMLGNHLYVGLLFAMFVAYFTVKWMLSTVVNLTFFGGKKNLQWTHAILFLTALEGIVLFPAAVLLVYFDVAIEKVLYFTIFVLVLNKMLTFYQSWAIFFKGKGRFVQTFLYFCALEITPLLAFCGAGVMLFEEIKVNY